MCFLLEYCSRGSLTHLLRHACGPIPEAAVWHMLHDLAQGLHHLHSLGIVHMDVKPSNVLVDESWRLKLSDFEIGFVLPEHASESHLTPLSFPTFAFSSELRPFTPPSVRSPHSSFKRLIPAIPPLPPVPTLTSSVDSPKPWNTSKASPDGVCDVAVSSSALPMCLPTLSEAKRPANLSLTSLNLCLDRDGVSPCTSPAPSPMGLLSSSFQPVPSRRMPAASECHLAQEPSASSAEVGPFCTRPALLPLDQW
jgi:serine/threonine protein kinase